MLRVTTRQAKRKRAARGPTKYVGILSDAAALGVSREHLWQVLERKRESRSLVRRYQELKGSRS